MVYWIVTGLSVLVACGLFVFGIAAPVDGFLAQALGSLVAVFAGVPLAMGLWRAEQRATDRRLSTERDTELQRLQSAAKTEIKRIRDTTELVKRSLDEGKDEVDRIVPMWSELLGPRFYQLTADDGPLHCLRHAHQSLANAIDSQNRVARGRERGGFAPLGFDTFEIVQAGASRHLDRAERWCEAASWVLKKSKHARVRLSGSPGLNLAMRSEEAQFRANGSFSTPC